MKNRILNYLLLIIVVFTMSACSNVEVTVPQVDESVEIAVELKELGYSDSEINSLKEVLNNQELDILTQYDYVANILNIINHEEFNKEKLENYLKSYFVTNNIDNSLLIVNNNISYVYNEKLASILNHKYFVLSRLDRYMNYQNEDIDTVIRNVNSNLDYEYYTNVKDVNMDNGKLILVNKYYKLASDYKNSDMVKMSTKYSNNDSSYLDKEAYEQFKIMVDDAAKEDINFVNLSSYRSYSRQEFIYNGYVKDEGLEYANKWSAKPGHSEHQTGLALDVCVKGEYGFQKFEKTAEYKWLKDNSYKYGFILRYPEGKEDITGYNFEAWHYRYVGVDIATFIYENDITYEEYYAYFIEK